jgi:hypothetical protein
MARRLHNELGLDPADVGAPMERAAEIFTMREARRVSERWRRRLGERRFSDRAPLIRQDRDSR